MITPDGIGEEVLSGDRVLDEKSGPPEKGCEYCRKATEVTENSLEFTQKFIDDDEWPEFSNTGFALEFTLGKGWGMKGLDHYTEQWSPVRPVECCPWCGTRLEPVPENHIRLLQDLKEHGDEVDIYQLRPENQEEMALRGH